MDMVVKFLVNDVVYGMALSELTNFPLENTLLRLLYDKFRSSQMLIETEDGAIVIKHPSKHFDKILKIYENPKITMKDLLDFDSMVKGVEDILNKPAYKEDKIIKDKAAEYLHTHPTYKLLKSKDYKDFISELEFYGVDKLFESKLNQTSFDQEAAITDIKDRIDSKINEYLHMFKDGHHIECGNDYKCDIYGCRKFQELMKSYYLNNISNNPTAQDLIRKIRALGGLISGSFILRSVVQEDWKASDLDIYANLHLLKSILPRVNYSYKPKKVFDDINDNIDEYYCELGGWIANYLNCEFKTLVPEEVLKADGYNLSSDLRKVLKFDFYGINIDMVLVICTPQYFIRYFDFEFNRLYYDGYGIVVMNWDSVITKTSKNRCRHIIDNKNAASRYIQDLKRIKKYFERGFVITTDDKEFGELDCRTFSDDEI